MKEVLDERPVAQGGAAPAQGAAASEGRSSPRERPRVPGGRPLLPSDGLPLGVPAARARRERHDMLAQASRLAGGGRVGRAPPRAPGRARGARGCWTGRGRAWTPRASPRKGGARTRGPAPVDRGKPGTKRHLTVEARGLPLAAILSGANRPDGPFLLPLLDAVPKVAGRRGPRRSRPAKLHADKAYDQRAVRAALLARGVRPRIARKGVESSERLGRWRVGRRAHPLLGLALPTPRDPLREGGRTSTSDSPSSPAR